MINRTLLTVVLLGAGLASAQATRVWVSGVGDDANPCSRTAPCLTIAGALTRVAAGGEVDLIDPAEIGEVIITQSVTISAEPLGGVQAPATGASVVIASPTAVVHLRNLHFIAASSGVPAIRVLDAASLSIEHCRFSGFTDSAVQLTGDGGALYVEGSHFRGDNLGGISINSPSTQNTVITDSTFSGHAIAIEATGPVRITATDTEFSANSVAAIRVNGGAQVNLERGEIVDSLIGVDSLGGVVRLSNSQLSGNGTNIHTLGNSPVHSFGNNRIVPSTCSLAAVAPITATVGVALPPMPLEAYGLLGEPLWDLPPLYRVIADGGVLAGTPMEVGHVTGTLGAIDQRGCVAGTPFDLNVVCPTLSISPASLSPVETGVDMAPVQFVVNGSTSSTTAANVSGALPLGLFSVDGGLVGMPNEPGSFPLTVNGVDGFGCMATQAVTLVVNASSTFQPTTLTLAANPPVYAQTVTSLVATLGPTTGTPTGFVTFYDGADALGSAAMTNAGTATLALDSFTAGTHSVTATYLGDATHGGSRAAAISIDVSLVPTTTTLEVSNASLIANVFSAIAAPTGQVEFTLDGLVQAPVPVNGAGEAIISTPAALGMHTAKARFIENTRFAGSESAELAVNVTADAGMHSDAGTGGGTGSDGGTNPGDTPKTGCGCNQADVGAMLFAALALFRRRRV